MLHGREGGEIRKRNWHMCSVPSTTVAEPVLSNSSSSNHFVKDGRKISVGDCALFKPAHGSPPFIGLIRSLKSDRASISRLSVNWLYRPVEVILGKGASLEAAPNEVFYSFHSDEIPAVSLLHPCKVAFLPKGAKLLPGVSSFVCRRVYDIANKCLWWLTDQDYIDDHQEEIDQLLHKTRLDMHVIPQQQQGAPSPKSVNGSAAMSPLKSSPDSIQNSCSNLSSQTKARKRERGAQTSEPNKRERSVKADGDFSQFRSESMLKLEIAKVLDKGGLADFEAVQRLVQLMQSEKPEKRINLSGRCMLAGVIAATDNVNCLSQFMQLRGLPVLDEWLQEAHKGKISEKNKDGDKSVEDFLLVLLRALDKLPVNLNALQTCNIGKSVNHLRSHKKSEIQKKARYMVDRWKKRVEAEININDAKSGSTQAIPWPGRSRCDSPRGGNRHSNGSSDAAIRSSVTHHSSLKSTSAKFVQGDSTLKSASAYQGSARSALSPASASGNLKDGQSKISTNSASSELHQAVVKEERSSNSSQSHTTSQCSSEHAKNTVLSGKEDAKSSTAASRKLNKMTSNGSIHQKLANGLQGARTSCLQGEAVTPSRAMPTGRISAPEKMSNSATDTFIHEGNNHRLIVKIPNRGRGPSQSIAGGCVDDFSGGSSRAFSPALSEKHDRGKQDARKSNEVDGLLTEVQHRTNNNRGPYLPHRNEIKTRKELDPSFSSMNALVESCVKFSEFNASLSEGDDAGMNLLASVAAGEILTSGIVSPVKSGSRNSAPPENLHTSYSANKKQEHAVEFMKQQCPASNTPDVDDIADVSKVNDVGTSKPIGYKYLHEHEEICVKSRGKLDELVSVASCIDTSQKCISNGSTEILSVKSLAGIIKSQIHLPVAIGNSSSAAEGQLKDKLFIAKSEKKTLRETAFYTSSNDIVEKCKQVQRSIPMNRISLAAVTAKSEAPESNEKATVDPSSAGLDLTTDESHQVKSEKIDGVNVEYGRLEANRISDQDNDPSLTLQKHEESSVSFTEKDQKTSCMGKNVDEKDACVYNTSNSAFLRAACGVASQEAEGHVSTKGSDMTAVKEEKKMDTSLARTNGAFSPASGVPDVGTKLGFDLNEGFSLDDGKSDEPVYASAGPQSDIVCSLTPMPISISSPCGVSASITVASAVKGAFVPSEDLLRNKMELFKGSAARSAFHPADPRKVIEVGSSQGLLPVASACKQALPPLDFDLNVADERILLEIGYEGVGEESNSKNNSIHEVMNKASLRCSGSLDLDLNKVDEASDIGHKGQRWELLIPPFKASPSSGFVNGEPSSKRDFDLNNGPAMEAMHFEQKSYNQHTCGSISFQPPFGPINSGSIAGNCFAWYPTGSSSVSMTPSSLPEQEAFHVAGIGSGGQHVIGGSTSSFSFNHDDYKGSVLSSTSSFHSPYFQYPVFPFGTGFRLPSSSFPSAPSGYVNPATAVPSPSVGNAAVVPFKYSQPFVSRPILDVTNNAMVENTQKRGKQGLDLNTGPRGVDVGGRNESMPIVTRQLSAISSQSLVEEQARMYSATSSVLKRKEPEGEWNIDKLNFRPSSWQ